MRVLLDTNIYCQDFRFRTNAMRLLLDEAKQGRIEIVVPSVVFQETVRRFREESQGVQRSLARFERDYGRLGFDVHLLVPVKGGLEDGANLYEQYLRVQLEAHNARFVDLPSAAHQQILDRIILRRKPISDDGKRGYQDTLIWETILELLQSTDAALYFITSNSSDFADTSNRNRLATDLIDDIALIHGDSKRVILFGSLREFTDEHVKPSRELSVAVESADSTPGQQHVASLLEGFLKGYAEELVGASPDAVKTTLPIEELAIARSEYSSLTIQEIFRISDREIGVSCMVEFRVTLQGYMPKDIDTAVLGSWTRQAESEFTYVRVRSDASLYVDMDLTLNDTYQEVIEAQPKFSWAEVLEPPPANQVD